MASLGKEAYVGRLIASESVTVSGTLQATQSIQSSHKVFGTDSFNLAQMHQKGSIFYLKWSHVKDVTAIATTNGSDNIVLSVAAHGLATGDSIFIQDLGAATGDVNGIPFADIKGARVVGTIASVDEIPITADSAATSTASESTITPLIRIDRYKYTDMAVSNATWQIATTEPTPTHTNTNIWY